MMSENFPASSSKPLVSAIIATYNRGYIVCEAIDSIINQTYKETEIIVVDDGSTDDTQDKLRHYGSRIRVVSQHNSGPAAAWNAGIRAAHGDIICFLGSDDVYLPNFVERHVSALEKAGPSVPCSLGNAVTRWADGKQTSSFELAALRPPLDEGLWVNALDVFLTRFVMCGQMLAIRREVFDRIGLFDVTLRYLEDYDIALRLSLEGPWAFISEPVVLFRQSTTGDSLSLSISPDNPRLHEYILTIRRRVADLMKARVPAVHSRYLSMAIGKAKRDIWALRRKNASSSVVRHAVAA
jgi:glycosyltransferase involved in cell wall biosynthesis